MRTILIFCLSCSFAYADLNRFVDSFDLNPVRTETKIVTKSSAYISSSTGINYPATDYSLTTSPVLLSREVLEKRLGESISHRYQASGQVIAYLTRAWTPIKVSSNFLVKISDCSPDELCSNTFARFSIWDSGKHIGNFAEPIRLGHYVDVLFSKSPLNRGSRLASVQLSKRPVDILKQYAGAVPYNSNIKGYQLASNIKANSPIKWNSLSKVTLVRKGQVVDVFASGNGIYVTMKGMALEDGVAGGNVTIKNLSSKKEFQAKVLNENSVKVHL